MSLEQQIQTLNENIGLLIAALAAEGRTPEPKPKGKGKKAKAETPVGQTPPEPEAVAKDTTESDADLTYDEVKAVILDLSAKKGRESVVELLARLGVARAPDLLPEQYSKAMAMAREALAA